MGATTFNDIGFGSTVEDAFARLKDQAFWECGHGGYTGTIAEKPGFVEFTLPPRWTFEKFVATVNEASIMWFEENSSQARRRDAAGRLLVERFGQLKAERLVTIYRDKWGPAVAVKLGPTETKNLLDRYDAVVRGTKVYGFCGLASC